MTISAPTLAQECPNNTPDSVRYSKKSTKDTSCVLTPYAVHTGATYYVFLVSRESAQSSQHIAIQLALSAPYCGSPRDDANPHHFSTLDSSEISRRRDSSPTATATASGHNCHCITACPGTAKLIRRGQIIELSTAECKVHGTLLPGFRCLIHLLLLTNRVQGISTFVPTVPN